MTLFSAPNCTFLSSIWMVLWLPLAMRKRTRLIPDLWGPSRPSNTNSMVWPVYISLVHIFSNKVCTLALAELCVQGQDADKQRLLLRTSIVCTCSIGFWQDVQRAQRTVCSLGKTLETFYWIVFSQKNKTACKTCRQCVNADSCPWDQLV